MAVGTGNITLQEVVIEIFGQVGVGHTLLSCFNESSAGIFNSTYVGSKDRLSNFKGYFHIDNGLWGLDDMEITNTVEYLC